MRLRVNGRPVETPLPRLTPLLAFLRNDLSLNGPKYGCGLGECGACGVLIDGRLARACVLTLGDVAGRVVTTLEGLGEGDRLDPVQEAFIACAAAQCGYCLNGMIMTARALIDCQSGPDGGRDPRGAALQPLPLRRACRDRRRCAACGGAGARMTALQPQGLGRADYLEKRGNACRRPSREPRLGRGQREGGDARTLRDRLGVRRGGGLQRPCRSRHGHPNGAGADRRRRTGRGLRARRDGARRQRRSRQTRARPSRARRSSSARGRCGAPPRRRAISLSRERRRSSASRRPILWSRTESSARKPTTIAV